MSFKPLTDSERRQLIEALWGNAASGQTILHSRDTSSSGPREDATDKGARSGLEDVPDVTD
jgi:hypothetical protein